MPDAPRIKQLENILEGSIKYICMCHLYYVIWWIVLR